MAPPIFCKFKCYFVYNIVRAGGGVGENKFQPHQNRGKHVLDKLEKKKLYRFVALRFTIRSNVEIAWSISENP